MNKSDLIKNISFKVGSVKKNDKEEAVNNLLNFISDSLLEKNRVEIRGFGVFNIKPTKERNNARNPKTNEIIRVPARRKISFKPGKILAQKLKKKIK